MKKILTIFTICLSLMATSCMNLFDKDELKQKNTITFYPGTYGTGTPATQVFELGKTQKLRKNSFNSTSLQYNFAGWAEKVDATGPTYADEAEISIKEDKSFYAIWSDINKAMFVKQNGGSDTNDGLTEETAYATFAPVFTKINSVDPTLPWVVNVVGAYRGSINVPRLNATNLTIQSKEGQLNTISLPSGGSGSVIKIESNAIVTLKNLEIEAGTGTEISTGIYYGGGVYVMAGATLTVDDAVTISGNRATYGGGIYNAGTLVLKPSCSITGNEITYVDDRGGGSGIYSLSAITGRSDSGVTITGNTPNPQVTVQ